MAEEHRPRIFLIEDDQTMISLLELLFRLENFDTAKIEKEETPHIISQIREVKPDVILMDVYLSKLSGLDILKEIREQSDLSAIKIIITSGSDMKDHCYSLGANDFILKPYMPDELIKMIHSQLQP